MSFLNKLGIAINGHEPREGRALPHSRGNNHGRPGAIAAGPHREPEMGEVTRVSNGLKEFLWNLDGLGHGTLLDLGPAWQTTLNFFIERGFRVTSEDILRGWIDFQREQESEGKKPVTAEDYAERTPEVLAKRFMTESLQYGPSSFDALLLWDVMDYMQPAVAKLMASELTEMLRPGGVVLAMFHSKKPEGFQRYRVMDTTTLQVLDAKPIVPAQKVYQNREVQDLFGRCRSMKSFIGRDQLREVLFIK